MKNIADLFISFKAVRPTHKEIPIDINIPNVATNWMDYMASRNNQILSGKPVGENVLPEPTGEALYPSLGGFLGDLSMTDIFSVTNNKANITSAPSVPSSTAQVSSRVLKFLKSGNKRFLDYMQEYDRYVQEHPEANDPNMRIILANIAAHESAYNPTVLNPTSSASGWFQFIDSTRRRYTSLSREQFKNDKQAQIDTAVKYYRALCKKYYGSEKWRNLIQQRGLTLDQVIYAGWFNPASLNHYLEKGRHDSFADAQGTTLQAVWSHYN